MTPIEELEQIKENIDELFTKACLLVKEHFPDKFESANQGGAFSMLYSGNDYNTTLESLIDDIKSDQDWEETGDSFFDDWEFPSIRYVKD